MPSKDPSTTSPVASDSVDEAFAKLGRLQALERLINKIDETDDTIPNNRLKRFPKYVTMHLLDDLDLYPEFVFERQLLRGLLLCAVKPDVRVLCRPG